MLGALMKLPLDLVRGEKAGRNARDGYATEHLEIASYELLRRVAEKAGDEETADVARQEIIEEEKRDGEVDRAELGPLRRALPAGRGHHGLGRSRRAVCLTPDPPVSDTRRCPAPEPLLQEGEGHR